MRAEDKKNNLKGGRIQSLLGGKSATAIGEGRKGEKAGLRALAFDKGEGKKAAEGR